MDDVRNLLLAKMKATGKSNEMTFKFKIMTTDESRVAIALNIMEVFQILPQNKCKFKDSQTSINLRHEANRIFISNKNNVDKLLTSWELYSKAIAIAPNTSQELSLAYANRSAVLFCFKKFEECIGDINHALELNYPTHLKGKLLFRKIECLYFLSNVIDIKSTIKEAKCWLEDINLSINEKNKLEEKLQIMESKGALLIPLFKNENKKETIFPNIVYNKLIPCASDALDVKYSDKFGRHIITTRKINAGDILIIEKPYATMLIPEKAYTHCSQCLNVYWALIPCEFCIHAMYCSKRCKNEAWKQYHDIECAAAGYLLELDFNKCALFSMRLSILALRELGSVNNLRSSHKDAISEEIFQSNKYHSLFTLVTNTGKRSISDLFERALNAAFILYYLCTNTTLFGKKFESEISQISTNKDATYVGGLILRNMQIIPSNIHSYEEECRINTIDIGVSAQPFCSLINHSCDPNVSRCSTGNGMLIYALVPIEPGSQIFDNYGSHYAVMNKFEREVKLKQYYFKCECRACKEDWPTYENLLPFDKLITNKKIKEEIETTLQNFNAYVEYAKAGDIESKHYLLEDLSKITSILIKNVPMPCCTVNNVIETLKRLFSLTYGNKFEIPPIN
ncbi:SET and MYND domain-containing protein 4 isoform X2 [Nasonia vitripennis]|uniref:Protein-lysine N-methyltransferase SMYD4 n=1 Tax=Nasonia vitripennis TaxID=7425 RepID=A0A7M7IRA2_NASVI|nr:SET and MYND domain-containing protein 4 isoform X2 [Nasonia vitripennis]XP_032457512.1 SET and MYND domain-containing protein 4 isoform X2 [Nasonia vitripennis]